MRDVRVCVCVCFLYGLLGCPSPSRVLLLGTTIVKGLRGVLRIRGVRALGFFVWPGSFFCLEPPS